MGSCVSKKAARAGGRGKVAAPLPAAEKEAAHRALPPVAEVDVEEEEEVKEVVLSETPAPPRPPRPPPPESVIKPTKEQQPPEAESSEASSSEACGASDTASVAKEKAKLLLTQPPGAEREAEKRAVMEDAPPRKGRAAPDQERESSKPRGGGAGTGRARSPSPSSSAHSRRQQQQHPLPPAARPRRGQPPVVSGIGCRSGRFSPSAARRAAESAVRRTHSAREADMALPSSKRSLSAAINGNGGGALSRRDPGERSGRRSDSPTGSRRAPASPSATHRPASPMRKAAAAAKEHGHGTPERARPTRARDGDEQPALAGAGGGERKKVEEGALGQNNPSVAMECFIFL
ncbi:unnamed protein product [Urochloa decumbens]|uniref:Uncharacterized protein n=1 Tax=Urochloa decumbens TaxID=240449 RepID=A0ABC8Y238_9POAL